MQNKNIWIALTLFAIVVCFCLCAAIMLALALFNWTPTSSNTPTEMFEAVLQKPAPADLADLQGGGDTWQGYRIFLRFRASETTVQSLLGANYAPVDCAVVLSQLKATDPNLPFSPAWDPQTVENPICYHTPNGISNAWTHLGEHYILIDPASWTVYFYGIGA